MFNRGLNAAEVSALYQNVNYGQPAVGPLTLSDSGEYALAAFGSTAEVGTGYLSDVQNSRWSNPLLSGISGLIVDTAVSQTGQNMVLVTSSGLNNVYYSTDYGATFTGLSIGSSALPSGALPLARLSLDNTNVDVQRALTPATGAGTVTYSTLVVKVGLSSALFSNTAGSSTPANYLNYTVPAALNNPLSFTMGCWMYPTALPVSNQAFPIGFNNGFVLAGCNLFITSSGTCTFGVNGSTTSIIVSSSTVISINTWTHIVGTISNGLASLYVNGVLQGTVPYTGVPGVSGGGAATNFFVGALHTAYGAFAGYIDDVRIYNTALSSTDILSLYNNAPALANDQSSPMIGCSISNDGSYLTVTNSAGGVYELNKNSTGYTIALGNQAGAVNQASNAIAIGNQAGAVNQSANSIVLNASGSAVNASSSGFYVAPIETTSGLPMDLLGYGSDSQVVKSGVTVLPGGNVGIGTTNPVSALTLSYGNNRSVITTYRSTRQTDANQYIVGGIDNYHMTRDNDINLASYIRFIDRNTYDPNTYPTSIRGGVITFGTVDGLNGNTVSASEKMRIDYNGNVGIGTTNPAAQLSIYNNSGWSLMGLYSSGATQSAAAIFSPTGTLSLSNPQWFIGQRYNMNGPLSIWPYDGGAHQGNVLTITGAGNVGIGTSNPVCPLHINSTGGASQSTRRQFVITYSPDTTCRCYFSVDEYGNLFVDPVKEGSYNASLLPAVDGSNPLGGASFRWSAVYSTNGTIQTSDSKEKDSQPLLYGINEVLQMRTIKYKWKSQADLPDSDPKKNFEYYGFCADELGPLFPELVYDEDTNTPIQMNYSELLPVVVNAVKEEHNKIITLEETAKRQTTEINELKESLSDKSTKLNALIAWATANGFSS
jgi:hypothetical protein